MLLEDRAKRVSLSHIEKIILDYIIASGHDLKNLSTRDIAKATYTSSASVVRLAKKLSFQGFDELKEKFLFEMDYYDMRDAHIDANFPFQSTDSIMDIANIMSELMINTAKDTLQLMSHDSLQKAVQIIDHSENIYIYALSANYYISNVFKEKMSRIGKLVVVEDLEHTYNALLPQAKDCAIIISYSGGHDTLNQCARILKNRGITMISITALNHNAMSKMSDCSLYLSTREKYFSKIAHFTNEYSVELVLNILYSAFFKLHYYEHLEYRTKHVIQLENMKKIDEIDL